MPTTDYRLRGKEQRRVSGILRTIASLTRSLPRLFDSIQLHHGTPQWEERTDNQQGVLGTPGSLENIPLWALLSNDQIGQQCDDCAETPSSLGDMVAPNGG